MILLIKIKAINIRALCVLDSAIANKAQSYSYIKTLYSLLDSFVISDFKYFKFRSIWRPEDY